jgi:predicted permease
LGGGAGRLDDRGWRWLEAIGRLKPGTSLAQARAELETLGRGLGAAYPDTSRGLGAQVYALSDSPWGGTPILRPVLLVLTAVVAIVLLAACANVANLLLARATARRREIAVRRSMGAGSARIVRQLLTESVLLGLAGGVGGILAAAWAAGLLARFIPPSEFPIALDFGVDARAAAFSAVLSLAAGILFGLAPALQSTRADVAQALRDETTAVVGGGKAPLRHALAVTQMALSVLLLVSAGLLVRSVRNVRFVDTGFEPRGVVLASLDLHAARYTPESGLAFYRRLLERVAALPGVESFTLARRAPLGFGGSSSTGLEVEGFRPTDDRPVFAFYNEVGPRYHATLRIPLVDGRDFAVADDAGAPLVAIVNETMAKWYWPGRSRHRRPGPLRRPLAHRRRCRPRHQAEEPGPAAAAVPVPSRPAGLPSGRRAACARGRRAHGGGRRAGHRGARAGPGAAGVGPAHARRQPPRVVRTAAARGHAARGVRFPRLAPLRDRPVRRPRLCRGPAHARDRLAGGPRRPPADIVRLVVRRVWG